MKDGLSGYERPSFSVQNAAFRKAKGIILIFNMLQRDFSEL